MNDHIWADMVFYTDENGKRKMQAEVKRYGDPKTLAVFPSSIDDYNTASLERQAQEKVLLVEVMTQWINHNLPPSKRGPVRLTQREKGNE